MKIVSFGWKWSLSVKGVTAGLCLEPSTKLAVLHTRLFANPHIRAENRVLYARTGSVSALNFLRTDQLTSLPR